MHISKKLYICNIFDICKNLMICAITESKSV